MLTVHLGSGVNKELFNQNITTVKVINTNLSFVTDIIPLFNDFIVPIIKILGRFTSF